jgi:hypothetical protein
MKYNFFSHLLLAFILLLPLVSFAQFQPLVGIPGVTDPNANFNTYINALYALSISIAGLLAVIKIIIAGVKYMLSDVVTSKQEAKSDIQGALIGLLIVVSAVLILTVINPQLTRSSLFLTPIDRPATPAPAQPSSGGATAPLPPGNNLPANTPVAEREIDCVREPSGSWNCSAATASCTGSGGRVEPEGSFISDPSDITCSTGIVRGVNCLSYFNSATQQTEADCTAAQASCPAGSTYTQLSEFNGQCYTPHSRP